MNNQYPVLYSFRRCPYAMRARLAIAYSSITVELREVVLRNKPQQLMDISAKATVPVIQLENEIVIDESLDIMKWALSYRDVDNWMCDMLTEDMESLIQSNDGKFKYYLDRYKYADRYPEHDEQYYRKNTELFLTELEDRLTQHRFLCSDQVSLADMAIFPFIRQFANVDLAWFKSSIYKNLNKWLQYHVDSHLFISIMKKYPAWREENDRLIVYFS